MRTATAMCIVSCMRVGITIWAQMATVISSEAAERIKELSDDGEQPWLTLAPPDLWNRRQETGQSAADIFAANGVTLTKTSNDRLDGWSAVKEWLRVYVDVDGSKRPDCEYLTPAKT